MKFPRSIELILCLVLGTAVVSACLQVGWRSGACYSADGWGKPNAAMRSAIDQVHRQIRLAGVATLSAGSLVLTRNSNPDTLILLATQTGPSLTIDQAIGIADQYALTAETPLDITAGDYALIIPPDGNRRVPAKVVYVDQELRLLTFEHPLGEPFPRGSRFVPVTHITYAIDRTDPDRPDLVSITARGERRVIAAGMSDFQIFWRLPGGRYADEQDDPLAVGELWIRLSALPTGSENYSWATALAVCS